MKPSRPVQRLDEAQAFLALLRGLLLEDAPAIIAIFTIRSDNWSEPMPAVIASLRFFARATGFWLEELAAPYYVFEDAGAP